MTSRAYKRTLCSLSMNSVELTASCMPFVSRPASCLSSFYRLFYSFNRLDDRQSSHGTVFLVSKLLYGWNTIWINQYRRRAIRAMSDVFEIGSFHDTHRYSSSGESPSNDWHLCALLLLARNGLLDGKYRSCPAANLTIVYQDITECVSVFSDDTGGLHLELFCIVLRCTLHL
ncbi:uncharacterized protein BT62DRAFT_764028 [Guyanagaster necrorhizus]|uniref:Uncharacterized protein n=1 Tax=Guyanagaster necrorhizus TaxID=856835 RepID=A0A9P7VXJ8_9AGAR|nr:uncharacterized protein BT62DRAFT_764028 [Guyanagaster necrorhizus MCA 3950]KAG7448305.1 hypothetical protein BT62DRAFT_764028 [Guyanagaster necrorhizus MCA 3950]